MKKAIRLFSVLALMMVLTACGNDDEGQNQSSEDQGGQSQESSQESSSQGGSEETSTQEESDSNQIGGWSEEMEGLKQAIVETLGDDYWPTTSVSPEMLESTYNITSDLYEDYMAEVPMISTNVDTLIILKVNEENVEAAEEALNNYREKMVNDTMQYPMNLGKIQASRIERVGNYVCFVQLGADTMQAEEQGEDQVIKHCQEQNELVITVIQQYAQ